MATVICGIQLNTRTQLYESAKNMQGIPHAFWSILSNTVGLKIGSLDMTQISSTAKETIISLDAATIPNIRN